MTLSFGGFIPSETYKPYIPWARQNGRQSSGGSRMNFFLVPKLTTDARTWPSKLLLAVNESLGKGNQFVFAVFHLQAVKACALGQVLLTGCSD